MSDSRLGRLGDSANPATDDQERTFSPAAGHLQESARIRPGGPTQASRSPASRGAGPVRGGGAGVLLRAYSALGKLGGDAAARRGRSPLTRRKSDDRQRRETGALDSNHPPRNGGHALVLPPVRTMVGPTPVPRGEQQYDAKVHSHFT